MASDINQSATTKKPQGDAGHAHLRIFTPTLQLGDKLQGEVQARYKDLVEGNILLRLSSVLYTNFQIEPVQENRDADDNDSESIFSRALYRGGASGPKNTQKIWVKLSKVQPVSPSSHYYTVKQLRPSSERESRLQNPSRFQETGSSSRQQRRLEVEPSREGGVEKKSMMETLPELNKKGSHKSEIYEKEFVLIQKMELRKSKTLQRIRLDKVDDPERVLREAEIQKEVQENEQKINEKNVGGGLPNRTKEYSQLLNFEGLEEENDIDLLQSVMDGKSTVSVEKESNKLQGQQGGITSKEIDLLGILDNKQLSTNQSPPSVMKRVKKVKPQNKKIQLNEKAVPPNPESEKDILADMWDQYSSYYVKKDDMGEKPDLDMSNEWGQSSLSDSMISGTGQQSPKHVVEEVGRLIGPDELVKINFEIKLSSNALQPSYVKFLDDRTVFDLEKAKSIAKNRIKKRRYSNFVSTDRGPGRIDVRPPSVNFRVDESPNTNPGGEQQNKKCQIINKIQFVNLRTKKSEDQLFNLEASPRKNSEHKSGGKIDNFITCNASKWGCFSFQKKLKFLVKTDFCSFYRSERRINLSIAFDPQILGRFDFLDYYIYEKIYLGSQKPKESILYANTVLLENSSLDDSTNLRNLVHPISLSGFERAKHLSVDLECLKVEHYIAVYLSKGILEKTRLMGKIDIKFLQRSLQREKEDNDDYLRFFMVSDQDQRQRGIDLPVLSTQDQTL